MTVDEMISSFRQYYDRITSYSAPGYLDAEILLFLNNAQTDVIKDRMFGVNYQPPAFEDNQKRVADLLPLISISSLVYTSLDSYNARQYTLPADFLYFIKAYATCTRSGYPLVSSSRMFECKFLRSGDIGNVYNAEYNRTHFLRPYITISGTTAKVIVDRYTTNSALVMHYINEPTELASAGSCDLPDHVHQDIVDVAVRQALQSISDSRWQTKVQDNAISSE